MPTVIALQKPDKLSGITEDDCLNRDFNKILRINKMADWQDYKKILPILHLVPIYFVSLQIIRYNLVETKRLYHKIMSTQEELEAVNAAFNEQLQQQIDGTLPKGHTYQLGMPSAILHAAGLPSLPIEMRATRLSDKSMQENHPFDLSEVKNLPKAIQNPLAVFRSATHLGSYVIMSELEHESRHYVVAVQTNQIKGKIEVNVIRSVYPKNNRQVANWLGEGLPEYINREKMIEWLSKQQSNSADVRKPFNDAAKVILFFDNPTPC